MVASVWTGGRNDTVETLSRRAPSPFQGNPQAAPHGRRCGDAGAARRHGRRRSWSRHRSRAVDRWRPLCGHLQRRPGSPDGFRCLRQRRHRVRTFRWQPSGGHLVHGGWSVAVAAPAQPESGKVHRGLGGGGTGRRLRRGRPQRHLERQSDRPHPGALRHRRDAPVAEGPRRYPSLRRAPGRRCRGRRLSRLQLRGRRPGHRAAQVQLFRRPALGEGHRNRRLRQRRRHLAGVEPGRHRCGADGEHRRRRNMDHGRLRHGHGYPQVAGDSPRGHRRPGRRHG